jgi:CO/xanthine dehydrogenase Mo-binding subunit
MKDFTRRDFLKTAGALVVSVAAPGAAHIALAQQGGKPPLLPSELDSWIAIHSNGDATAFFGKMDMGQGVDVAVQQMVAEELDLAFERVQLVMGDTALTCNQGGASGSTGLQRGGVALRNAAAEARRVLVERAAQQLGVPAGALKVSNGVISDGTKETTYAELIGGQYFHQQLTWNKVYGNQLSVNGAAKPKHHSEYQVVGKTFPQKVITEKVMGRLQYITDFVVDGMVHARVIRPLNAGCSLLSVDDASIKHIPGAHVVRDENFLAVVANKEWDAVRAANALKVTWSDRCDPFPPMAQLFEHIRKAPVAHKQVPVNRGNVDEAFKSAAKTVEFEYEWPLQSHASMGPACAVADMTGDAPRLWTGSQKPHYGRTGCARITGIPVEKMRSTWIAGPGSYGRNDAGDCALDAALISKAIGKPVRVQYMRHDGTAWDPKGPAGVFRGRAALDAAGNVTAYDFHAKGFSRQDVIQLEGDPKDTLAGQFTRFPPKGNHIYQIPAEAYTFANKRCGWETIPAMLERGSPLRTGHIRDPLGPETHFASESFIDELAQAAGTDPVAFRLKYLTRERDVAVIKAAAELAHWKVNERGSRGKGNVMRGRGFAYTERNGTVVALVAEVEVDRRTGRIWGKKFWCAHDCGQIINPGSMRNVLEGNIVQALSRTLFEEVRFDRNQVLSVDWATYPILDLADTPEAIEIKLIDRPEMPPQGAGEPSHRTVPAAIANAIFDATGVRMRKAPLTAERMKAALSRAA